MRDPADITVKAVLAEALRLRERAEAIKRNDPYAKPYEPGDWLARKLSTQHGPAGAIEVMRIRAADVDNEYREQNARAERAAKKHKRHLEVVEASRRHVLADQTIGQRLDRALRGLGAATNVPATRPDSDKVTGSKEKSREPRGEQSDADRLRDRALVLVMHAEDALERSTPADLWPGGDAA